MVSVMANHVFPHGELEIVDTHQAVFFKYQYAQFVAYIQQFRCHGIMAGSIGIGAEAFHSFYAVTLESVRDGGAYAGMILMVVQTMYFYMYAVEKQSFVFIHAYRPQSCACIAAVHDLPVQYDFRAYVI